MKKYLLLAGLLLAGVPQIQAQSFGRVLVDALASGLNNALQQQQSQQRNSNSFSLNNSYFNDQSKGKQFRLENSYFNDLTRNITFNDGSRFYGFVVDGKASGHLYYADGTYCHGNFDSNWNMTEVCLVIYTDGTWYYGNFRNNVMHGEGSIFTGGKYYNVVHNMGEMTDAVETTSPKFNKADHDEQMVASANFGLQLMQQQDAYSSSSYSSSSSSTRSNTSRIQRQADVTAKAYEEYKRNPNATTSQYYHSNQKLLDSMQGR